MDYYDILIDGISAEIYVSRIIHTRSWIAAELSDGRYGIALHDKLQSRERMFPTLEGLTARKAAEAVRSWNLLEASEAMAVINAFYNTEERLDKLSARCGFDKSCTQAFPPRAKKSPSSGTSCFSPTRSRAQARFT